MLIARRIRQSVSIKKQANLNVRTPIKEPGTERVLDLNLHLYGNFIMNFLLKRRVTREEIWPKIHILPHKDPSELPHLSCQQLAIGKNRITGEMMKRIAEEGPEHINSAFIVSLFCEEGFKELLDAYVGKVLVCGKAARNQQQQKDLQSQAKNLFDIFYYGENLSPLERLLESNYLSKKQEKSMRFGATKDIRVKNVSECIWTKQDQRLVEGVKNWPILDPEKHDIAMRLWFEPLDIDQLSKQNRRVRGELVRQSQSQNEFGAIERVSVVTTVIFTRISHWLNCLQFTNFMQLPYDYRINTLVLFIHVWLVADRLSKSNKKEVLFVSEQLLKLFFKEIELQATTVYVKKPTALAKILVDLLKLSQSTLNFHFNQSEKSSANPYLGIDALVWSIPYCEMVERYSDQIYIFSEYFIQAYQNMQRHSDEQIMNGVVEFDVFLISPRYKQNVMEFNPQMPADEFQKQFNQEGGPKDYYYSKAVQNLKLNEKVRCKQQEETKFSFSELFTPFVKFFSNFFDYEAHQHRERIEQARKENLRKEKQSAWKGQKENLDEIQTQLDPKNKPKTPKSPKDKSN